MKYNQQLNYQKRKRFLFRVRILCLLIILPAFGAGIYLYYSVQNRENSNTEETTTSQQTNGYFASSIQIFKSPYFQFQADKTWAEVPAESTATKFVYRSLRANLVEHDLTIYVNNIPQDLTANRTLPVNLKNDSELLPITVSEHCKKNVVGAPVHNPVVKIDNVTLRCDADSTNYTILTGLAGGNTTLNLKRPDGSRASYSILYSNLKATPDASQLSQISGSFQTR